MGQSVSLLLLHSAWANGLMLCVSLLNSLRRLFLMGPKLEESPVNEEGGIERDRGERFSAGVCFFLRNVGLLDSSEKSQRGKWWALPLEWYKSVNKVIALPSYLKKQGKVSSLLFSMHFAFCLLLCSLVSGLAVSWTSGELCHLQPLTTAAEPATAADRGTMWNWFSNAEK